MYKDPLLTPEQNESCRQRLEAVLENATIRLINPDSSKTDAQFTSDLLKHCSGLSALESHTSNDQEVNRPRRSSEAPDSAAALEYAKRIATSMWERDWKEDAPNWQPCDDIFGILTQIDNMVAGNRTRKPTT